MFKHCESLFFSVFLLEVEDRQGQAVEAPSSQWSLSLLLSAAISIMASILKVTSCSKIAAHYSFLITGKKQENKRCGENKAFTSSEISFKQPSQNSRWYLYIQPIRKSLYKALYLRYIVSNPHTLIPNKTQSCFKGRKKVYWIGN